MALVTNKKAHFNYELGDKIIAGIELLGHEAKSLRNNQGSLEGSYVIIRGGEAFLVGAQIPPYQPGNTSPSYDERRNRKILLHKKEIEELSSKENGKHPHLIPLAFFAAGPKIKLEIAKATGKKKHDKRKTIEKRDTSRQIHRELKKKR